MRLSTLDDIVGRVLQIIPAASPELARHWVTQTWLRFSERRHWSWKLKRTHIALPDAYTTGTVDATEGSTTLSGTDTVWTSSHVGRQIRLADGEIYTVTRADSTTSLEISPTYAGETVTGAAYTIWLAYVTPPSDFLAWVSVVDMEQGHCLNLDATMEELDAFDPDRTRVDADPQILCGVEYATDYTGKVSATIQAFGSGPKPSASGSYTGLADAIFTIEVTTSGIAGVAEFQWKKNEGSYTTAVVTLGGSGQELQEGVWVSWGAGTFVDGDIFVVRATPIANPGLPKYEVYPHQYSHRVLTAWYVTRAADLEENGGVLPRYVRGDIILEGSLEQGATWPGPDQDHPNPYCQISRREYHTARFEMLIAELERQDNEIFQRDLSHLARFNYATLPWDSYWSGVNIRQDGE